MRRNECDLCECTDSLLAPCVARKKRKFPGQAAG